MPKFNNGKPYHGSNAISGGRLEGSTGETDYFYFFCPKCHHREVMRILDYGEHTKQPVNEYDAHCKSKSRCGFAVVFKLYCEKCGHSDFVKISNMGWQGGKHSVILAKA
jgi:hypothetical protein